MYPLKLSQCIVVLSFAFTGAYMYSKSEIVMAKMKSADCDKKLYFEYSTLCISALLFLSLFLSLQVMAKMKPADCDGDDENYN